MIQSLENPPKSPERPKRYTRFKMTARKKTIQKPQQQQQQALQTRSQTTKKRKEKEQLDEEEKEIEVKSKRITKKQKEQEEEEKDEEEDIKEVKEDEVKPKRLQYRSNLYSIVSLLHDVKFNQVQSEQIQKSPFANMFAITEGSIDEQMVKKSDPILVKLIETYKRGQAKFLLAGKDIALTDLELGIIFGITSGPVKIHIATHGRRPDTKFANRVFAGASTMHLPTMRVTIENILKPPVKKKQKKK